MNPGPARGEARTRTFTVTETMTARIGGREIHPVYGTTALASDVERICREILEPHLEPGEEGVGYRLEVVHHSPAPVGAEVTITATVADVGNRRLLCEVGVREDGRLVASGSFEQRIVSADEFAARVRELRSLAR